MIKRVPSGSQGTIGRKFPIVLSLVCGGGLFLLLNFGGPRSGAIGGEGPLAGLNLGGPSVFGPGPSALSVPSAPASAAIPNDFPTFFVPGHEKEMEALRSLYWEHFIPDGMYWDDWLYAGADGNPAYPRMPAGPKATLWDEWLCGLLLWPAVDSDGSHARMAERWNRKFSTRRMDGDGYVDTDQGIYFAHKLGWPFPVWSDGRGGRGWHFSFIGTPGWYRPNGGKTCRQDGWTLDGAADKGIDDLAWNIDLVRPDAAVITPEETIDTFQAPFLELRWRARHLGAARPRLEWTTPDDSEFRPGRSLPFPLPEGEDGQVTCTMIPMYRHAEWKGDVRRIRIRFGNTRADAEVGIQGFFTTYDTRHNINNMNFVRGAAIYFWHTRDVDFLKRNIDRIRRALRFAIDEHHVRTEKLVLTTWPGHDGLGSIKVNADGSRSVREGHGLTDNWWDMLPFGHKDFYATVFLYDALGTIARLEGDIRCHPEWDVKGTEAALDPEDLGRLAAEIKARGNDVFWNQKTGRFYACVDSEGSGHDYGYVSPNLEAVHFDFATPDHARSILDWLTGGRRVEGDTARGGEIYRWIFAPLTTTRHNPDWWSWPNTGNAAWGSGIQDGGCVLGYSYYDLMARLKVMGPDNSWQRLRDILTWYIEVRKDGGYKEYYTKRGGSLQGGGAGGNLGITQEFWESAMVPQVMLNGFMGFRPESDGLALAPALPSGWSKLTIDRIRLHGATLGLTAARDRITIARKDKGGTESPGKWRVRLPGRVSSIIYYKEGRAIGKEINPERRGSDLAFEIDWTNADTVSFEIR